MDISCPKGGIVTVDALILCNMRSESSFGLCEVAKCSALDKDILPGFLLDQKAIDCGGIQNVGGRTNYWKEIVN